MSGGRSRVASSPGSPLASVDFLGGSKVATRNNCTHAKESLGMRLYRSQVHYGSNENIHVYVHLYMYTPLVCNVFPPGDSHRRWSGGGDHCGRRQAV